MLLRHSLVGSDIAEHPVLLLIVSSHAATTNTSRCGLGVIFQQPASAFPDTFPNRSAENQGYPRMHVQSPAPPDFFRTPDTTHRVRVRSKYSPPCQCCPGRGARSQTQR